MKKIIIFIKLILEAYKQAMERKEIVDIRKKMSMKRDHLRSKRDFIIKLTCECAGIDYYEFMDNKARQYRKYVYPRYVCMTIMHYALMYSQEETEQYFEKGHPAVIYGKNKMKDLFKYDPELRDDYEPVLRYANKLNPLLFKTLEVSKFYPEEDEKESIHTN